ncbi:MAG: hypothetical protein NC827_09880 [Candidatus Omnitrophica bacterium]|nr:hypothetical protein [Candidatus Omnitrophota bacterium]
METIMCGRCGKLTAVKEENYHKYYSYICDECKKSLNVKEVRKRKK